VRQSSLLLRTLREAPADAEAASHRLLVRAGYIRRLASGVYSYLPLGWRVLRRIEGLIRREMEAAGAQEVLLPVLAPVELFEQTGRRASMADILFEVTGSGGTFALGPTHEEVVTELAAATIDSYRQLPVTVFQIQTKFRDEARPRFGLLRGREFTMKDAYSFDADQDGMRASYRAMFAAYERIFAACDVEALPVEASSGAIGGDVNHEFMVPSPIGEDTFAHCAACGYRANTEAAEAGAPREPDDARQPEPEPLVEHHTPDRPGIDLVVEHFADRGLTAAGMLKCIALKPATPRLLAPDLRAPARRSGAKTEIVIALVPGDREVRVPAGLEPLADDDFAANPELHKGYIGPMGIQAHGVRVIADHAVGRSGATWVTGANRADHHVTGATLGRDFTVDEWASIATVAAGDPCPRCDTGTLDLVRAVEAGHTFQLGLTYSTKVPGATFVDHDGKEQLLWMGCYGIGVSRLLAVVAEAHHDDAGLAWPAAIAPFQVHVIALGADRNPDVAAAADRLHDDLTAAGVEVLYDDRDASAGSKFADADLLGIPVQLVVGAKGLARGVIERKIRATGARDEVAIDTPAAILLAL
jgi:prolyl-tRNA synthetase